MSSYVVLFCCMILHCIVYWSVQVIWQDATQSTTEALRRSVASLMLEATILLDAPQPQSFRSFRRPCHEINLTPHTSLHSKQSAAASMAYAIDDVMMIAASIITSHIVRNCSLGRKSFFLFFVPRVFFFRVRCEGVKRVGVW